MTKLKSGPLFSSLNRSVVSLLAVVAALSICLRCLDEFIFFEDTDGVAELCMLLALGLGSVYLSRTRASNYPRPISKVLICTVDESPRPNRPRPKKMGSRQASVEDGDIEQRLTDIVAACKASDFALADAYLCHLPQVHHSLTGDADALAAEKMRRCQKLVDIMMQACLEAKEPLRAVAWLDTLLAAAFVPSSRTLQAVLDALFSAGEMQKAEDLLARMLAAGISVDINSVQQLFEHCVPPSDVSKVEVWLDRLAARSDEDLMNGYIAILRSKWHMSSGCDADFWMNRAIKAGVAKKVDLYNATLHACAQFADIKRCKKWMQKISEVAIGQPHLAPNVDTYSAMIDACVQRGETARAESWFNQMVESGIKPDMAIFNILLKSASRSGDGSVAEHWLQISKEHGHQPDISCYNSLIAGAARTSNPALAERLLQQLLKEGATADVVSYNCVINAMAKQCDADGAERIINLMCDTNVEPDVVTLGTAIHACARALDLTRAEAIFRRIVARGKTQPHAVSFNALINASVKANDTVRAEFWLAKMLEAGVAPSVVSYTTVLHAYARAGDIEAAERGLALMKKNGVEANVVSYSALIHACTKAGDVTRAEKWFEEMQHSGIKSNAVCYSTLIDVCAKAGDYKRAELWLANMCKDGVPPNVVCYNNVIDACAKAAQAERAEQWLWRLAGEKELTPTRQSFTTAAQAYALQGYYSEAERIISSMEERKINMDEFSLTVLLSAYARARPRQKERAEAAFEDYCARGLPVTRAPLRVLKSITGAARFEMIVAKCGIKVSNCRE